MLTRQSRPNSNSPLIRLPQEIISLITGALASHQDGGSLIRLSLTCGYFFRLLVEDIQALIQVDVGVWCKDRTVFAGGIAHGIPGNVGTAEEEEEWFAANYNTLDDMDTEFVAHWGIGDRLCPDQILNQLGRLVHCTKLSMLKDESNGSILFLDRLGGYGCD
ncbi:hypothetical protein F53441_12694 [Fusarium austroafricanum]|uniref:F-box domain-containing protein n=1 Tax=Fusarium austroafricanum TaxID=2364996 RepID=A0A8H4NN07_9HYPO|nr:hypothetical protein F53441_12694 [Fusarium austroafricanum]